MQILLVAILHLAIVAALPIYAQQKSTAERNYLRANNHGTIGNLGNIHLVRPGFFSNLAYNDIAGGTDKHLSQETHMGVLRTYSHSSVQATASWRFITKDGKKMYGLKELQKQPGRFADWISIDFAYKHDLEALIGWHDFLLQIEYGIGHVGDHGAKIIHTNVHRFLDNLYENLYYQNQPEGSKHVFGVEISKVYPLRLFSIDGAIQSSLGSYNSHIMNELYLRHQWLGIISPDMEIALENRIVRQLYSRTYKRDGALPWRYEFAVAMYIAPWFKPSLKWISPFLQNDDERQLYLDLLNINIPF